MSFSYDATQLDQPLNQLRFLVQDTVEQGRYFEDEEITFVNNSHQNIHRAAAQLCRSMAAKLAQQPNFENEAMKYDATSRANKFIELADKYDEEAARADKALESSSAQSSNSISLFTNNGCPAFTRDM
jgi:hypothetical protein